MWIVEEEHEGVLSASGLEGAAARGTVWKVEEGREGVEPGGGREGAAQIRPI